MIISKSKSAQVVNYRNSWTAASSMTRRKGQFWRPGRMSISTHELVCNQVGSLPARARWSKRPRRSPMLRALLGSRPVPTFHRLQGPTAACARLLREPHTPLHWSGALPPALLASWLNLSARLSASPRRAIRSGRPAKHVIARMRTAPTQLPRHAAISTDPRASLSVAETSSLKEELLGMIT